MLSGSWSFASGIKHAHAHPHARRSSKARASRASSCCRSARRRSSTTGMCWACARPAASTTASTTSSCPRLTRTPPRRETPLRGGAALQHRHHRLRRDLPLGVGVRHRPAAARRAGGESARRRRPFRHAGEQRGLPRTVRQGRGSYPRGARVRLRDLGRRGRDARPRRALEHAPAHHDAAGAGARHVDVPRRGAVRLHLGRHGRAAHRARFSACSATCTPARSTSPRRRPSSATPVASWPGSHPGRRGCSWTSWTNEAPASGSAHGSRLPASGFRLPA